MDEYPNSGIFKLEIALTMKDVSVAVEYFLYVLMEGRTDNTRLRDWLGSMWNGVALLVGTLKILLTVTDFGVPEIKQTTYLYYESCF